MSCRLRLGALDLDLDWRVRPTVTAVVGPSGAGKTTLLYVIAGLARPDEGEVEWNGRRLEARARRGRVHVKPQHRRIGYVFQEARLFPHLTVAENLRYSPRLNDGDIGFEAVVSALGLSPVLSRRPGALSGGERQRVALGRALLSQPELLLLDEPVSALDLPVRLRFMRYIQSIHRDFGIPSLFVSHDPELVASFAEETAVMAGGRIVRSGPTREMLAARLPGLHRPRTNLLAGRVLKPADVTPKAGTTVCLQGGVEVRIPPVAMADGANVWLRILATDLLLMRGAPDALSARNVLPCVVRSVRPADDHATVTVEAGPLWTVHVIPTTVEALGLAVGERLQLVAKATSFEVIEMAD